MVPRPLRARRDQMYAAHAVYIQARQGYVAALHDRPDPDVQRAYVGHVAQPARS
jgi:hypothetical protein